MGVLLLALAVLFAFFPRAFAYVLALASGWIALALLYRGYRLYSHKKSQNQRE
jgi:hypothetical protein